MNEDRTTSDMKFERLSFYILVAILLLTVGLAIAFALVVQAQSRAFASRAQEDALRDTQIACFIADQLTHHRERTAIFFDRAARELKLNVPPSDPNIRSLDCEDLLDELDLELPDGRRIEIEELPRENDGPRNNEGHDGPSASGSTGGTDSGSTVIITPGPRGPRGPRGPSGDDDRKPRPRPSPSCEVKIGPVCVDTDDDPLPTPLALFFWTIGLESRLPTR